MLFFFLRESDYIVIYDLNYPYTKNMYLQDLISTDYYDPQHHLYQLLYSIQYFMWPFLKVLFRFLKPWTPQISVDYTHFKAPLCFSMWSSLFAGSSI